MLKAEDAYTVILREEPSRAHPGATGAVTVFGQEVEWEIRDNRIWRFGRLFLRCPVCDRPATRVYLPLLGAGLACRLCWGLSYRSRRNSYRRTGWSAVLGTIGASETGFARSARRKAAQARQNARRAILGRQTGAGA